MKIVADKNIPFLEGVFEPYCEVAYVAGKEITRADLVDADALIIRTRTRCDARLLEGTPVKIIATATIGMDHIDFDYCNAHKIEVHNAQGCNAGGVAQYVFSALFGVAARKAMLLKGSAMGIIGVGHVGSLVADMARKLGFRLFLCDPPRAAAEGPDGFCSLEELLDNCQIVTMHTPLDETTRAMANDNFFNRMQPGAIFINASRGEVVDDGALKRHIPKLGAVVIDTWNNEPDIDAELVDMVDIATPHIAGYSYQGKQNGTAMSVRAVARHLGIVQLYNFFPRSDYADEQPLKLDVAGMSQGEIAAIFQYNYPVFTDDFILRMNPENFEKIRTDYQYRREFYL